MKRIEITQITHRKALEQLCDELNLIISNNNDEINNIVSNGNICSTLQEHSLYTLKDKLKKDERYYSIGEYNKVDLIVDTLQLWTDNKIVLRNDNTIIEEIEIVDGDDMLI